MTLHWHFSNYVLAPYLEQGRGEQLAASTFGNPNLYALFLATGAPILLYRVSVSRTAKEKACYVVLMLWLLSMLLYSGSRLGLAATVMMIVVWFACTRKGLFSLAGMTILAWLAVVVLTSAWPPFASLSPLRDAPVKIANTTVQEVVPTAPIAPTPATSSEVASGTAAANSGNVRVNLARNGWDMLVETHGAGVGPGNFRVWLKEHGGRYPVAGVYSPHNAVLELATQYGVLATLFAFALFVVTVGRALRMGLRPKGPDGPLAVLVFSMAIGLPLCALCSSSFWDVPSTWVSLTLFLLAGTISRKSRAQSPRGNRAAGQGTCPRGQLVARVMVRPNTTALGRALDLELVVEVG